MAGGSRGTVVAAGMANCDLSVDAREFGTARNGRTLSLIAIGTTAFCLVGPYAVLAGAIAMDLGGRKGSATAAGLIDTAGYIGGTLSGFAVGRIADTGGWASVFSIMAAIAAAVALIALGYCVQHRRRIVWRPQPQPQIP